MTAQYGKPENISCKWKMRNSKFNFVIAILVAKFIHTTYISVTIHSGVCIYVQIVYTYNNALVHHNPKDRAPLRIYYNGPQSISPTRWDGISTEWLAFIALPQHPNGLCLSRTSPQTQYYCCGCEYVHIHIYIYTCMYCIYIAQQ